jgi:hypothetical protein
VDETDRKALMLPATMKAVEMKERALIQFATRSKPISMKMICKTGWYQ